MIPPKTDPLWRELVYTTKDYNLSGLATKMLLMRVRLITKNDPNKVSEAIDIAYEFFNKNSEFVQDDIQKILGLVGNK